MGYRDLPKLVNIQKTMENHHQKHFLMGKSTNFLWSMASIARFGAMSQNIVVATAYATLGTDAVVHAVNEGDPGIFPGSVEVFPNQSSIYWGCPLAMLPEGSWKIPLKKSWFPWFWLDIRGWSMGQWDEPRKEQKMAMANMMCVGLTWQKTSCTGEKKSWDIRRWRSQKSMLLFGWCDRKSRGNQSTWHSMTFPSNIPSGDLT